jgi:hypothetical protein
MLVLAKGLVDEHKPPRIDRRLTRLPPLTPPGDVQTVLFGGAKAFFECYALMLEKMPKRIIAHQKAALGQLLEQSAQGEIRLLGDPRKNPISLARHKVRPAAAHFQRRWAADGALTLRPLHNAGDADHERLGCRTAGLTRRHRRDNSLPQVQRISSSHSCRPPIPASHLRI